MSVKVTLKVATSLDGKIALADGTSQWITGSDARARVHDMRAAHDAVLIGVGTVLADDPLLTARPVPLPESQPARIVFDSRGRTPPASRLVGSLAQGRVIVATAGQPQDILQSKGVDVWRCGNGIRVDIADALKRCEVEGYTKLFLEGGGILAAEFLRLGFIDTIHWFRAPIIIGGDGIPGVASLGLTDLSGALRWRNTATERIGDDVLDTYIKA